MNKCGERNLTYCAISRLGIIPVVGCEMMEPMEDILVRHTRQTGWGVGPGNESGGREGHGKNQRRRGEVGIGRWGEDSSSYKEQVSESRKRQEDEPIVYIKFAPGGFGMNLSICRLLLAKIDRPIVIVSDHPPATLLTETVK